MSAPEAAIQRAVVAYLRYRLPRGSLVHHSPHGATGKGLSAAIANRHAASMGALDGWPDLTLVVRGRLYAMECKTDRGTLSKAQKAVRDALVAQGVPYAVVRSADDAASCCAVWESEWEAGR